jgi:hypothetical protein
MSQPRTNRGIFGALLLSKNNNGLTTVTIAMTPSGMNGQLKLTLLKVELTQQIASLGLVKDG